MPNSVYFTLTAALAAGLIALALVFPQGLGTRSPPPFGHRMGPVWTPKPAPAHQLRDAL